MKMSKEEIDRWSKEPFIFDSFVNDNSSSSRWVHEHNCKCWEARKEAGLVEHKGATTGEIITVIAIILLFMIGVCPAIA